MTTLQQKHIKKGSTFQIELKGNASTGMNWCLKTLPSSLMLVGTEVYPDPHPRHVVGYGNTQAFTFKAIATTTQPQLLEFVLMRVWETEAVETQQFEVTVSEHDHEVSYQVINNYFSGNTLPADEQRYFVFDDLKAFQSVFHPAATMGPQTWLTEKDFKQHLVVAVVEPEAQAITEYAFNTPPYIENDTLVLNYRTEQRPTVGTTFRFSKIIMVERGDYQAVRFIDNEHEITEPVPALTHA
ncbi:protease inhibitor I42 family protein [Vibrio sp. St2]|nr:protease inhibitor I42 family protein [Vibrio sp. St2]QXL80243.1 protease inhibitor I42 family protein [Vibrio sp.]